MEGSLLSWPCYPQPIACDSLRLGTCPHAALDAGLDALFPAWTLELDVLHHTSWRPAAHCSQPGWTQPEPLTSEPGSHADPRCLSRGSGFIQFGLFTRGFGVLACRLSSAIWKSKSPWSLPPSSGFPIPRGNCLPQMRCLAL